MIETFFAIGIVVFLMLYLAFQLEKDHFLLQVFLVLAAIFMLVLIPKAVLDVEDNCGFVPVNSTQVGDVVTYQYDYLCETNTKETPTTFYKATLWIVRIFVIYVFIYFVYRVLRYLMENAKT